jgi:hypothetical protein
VPHFSVDSPSLPFQLQPANLTNSFPSVLAFMLCYTQDDANANEGTSTQAIYSRAIPFDERDVET